MTTDKARKIFNEYFTYGRLKKQHIYLLVYFVQNELDKFENKSMEVIKININMRKNGLKFAEILIKGSNFKSREGITFNEDGFIGFAGWADSENWKPFVTGFCKWVDYILTKEKL